MANTFTTIQVALSKHQAGELEVAEQMYRQILLANPSDAGLLNLLGVALLQQNKFQEAEAKILQAINLNPKDASFHFNLGVATKFQGKTKQAEESYRNALGVRPYYPEATRNLGNLLEAQKQYEASVSLYQQAVKLNPRDLDAHIKLADLYRLLGDWANTIAYCQKVMALQPGNPFAQQLYMQAMKSIDQGQLVGILQTMLSHNPQHGFAHFRLSQVLAKRGEIEAAMRHAKMAVEVSPQVSDVQLNYACMKMLAKQYELSGLVKQMEAGGLASGEQSALEQPTQMILRDDYANVGSLSGWLFSTLIDYRFIDGSLRRLPIQRRLMSWNTCDESPDIVQAATAHLARIGKINDIRTLYAALESLTLLDTPALTHDSFADMTEAESDEAVRRIFSAGKLNLVIIGAGPVGLLLASAMKLALHSKVNVLVVENRVSSLHHKLPYERRWVTNLPLAIFQGLVEESLSHLFTKIGKLDYIGCTLNVLESLLLLSCRQLGVKFLFSGMSDISFIQDSQVEFVFDATGNRFRPPAWPESPGQIVSCGDIETRVLGFKESQFNSYGIHIDANTENSQITLGAHEGLLFPLYKNQPIKLAMLKLIHIPARLHVMLLSYVAKHNDDNKFYVWPGTLQGEINQTILIINLDKLEYEYLCKHHVFPMSLAEAVQLQVFGAMPDNRTGDILKLLAEQVDEKDQVGVDAPFLFEPYLVNRMVPAQLYGKPLIGIGDSVYCGHVKLGNGLGSHIMHLHHIQKVLQKYAQQ